MEYIMAEEIEMTASEEIQKFTNDINDELKDRIRQEAAKRIDEILDKPVLTRGDLVHLTGVSNGSVKNRAKKIESAAELIVAVLDGVRATGTRQPSVESVKSFLDSLSPEDKAKFLAQIAG